LRQRELSYVALHLLLDLEKELITFGTQLGFRFEPRVSVQQLKAFELNAYAYELAQVSVQIGYLKWRRDNGWPNENEPVLQDLDEFLNEDSLLVPHYRSKAKTLKEAQAGEHRSDDALKFYTERKWPNADVIVGNPPFLGSSRQWDKLGRSYCDTLQRTYGDRVPGAADLCCYWFAKATDAIKEQRLQRAGLLATQAIRGGVNREVLNRIKREGDIFFAVSDQDWILEGANVHVSMVGFDNGTERTRILDGHPVAEINPNLTAHADITVAKKLRKNAGLSFSGTKKSGDFDVAEDLAAKWLTAPNPHGRPNSDLLRPWLNGSAIVKRTPPRWIIDTRTDLTHEQFALYEALYLHAVCFVKPDREKNKRSHRRLNWWLHAETCAGMREALLGHKRFLATPRVSKFRIFAWSDAVVLPDDGVFVFSCADDYFFGVLHSRFHEVWSLKLGTRLETRPRYTPTSCFETFPFPKPNKKQEGEVAAAAKELNDLRENWLNPPEWTLTRELIFLGSIDGPWSRFVHKPDKHGIGTVRYPRVEPRDEEVAKKLAKRTLTNLYNERPAWLANAHATLDAAVAAAYGFEPDLSDEAILEKLLALNVERSATEQSSSSRRKPRTSREKTSEELI
jgi:hypothetical protein